MKRLHVGMTVTCTKSEGVYVLLEDLGSKWRCFVVVADPFYGDLETEGAEVRISTSWLNGASAEVV